MKTRNGLFADVPEEQWNDWHWQVRNRAETLDDLKKIMTLTPEEEEGVKKTLGKLTTLASSVPVMIREAFILPSAVMATSGPFQGGVVSVILAAESLYI